MKRLLPVFIAANLVIGGSVLSAQIVTSSSGNWNDPATWDGGTVPAPNATFSVLDGHEVTASGLGAIQDHNANVSVYGTLNIGAGTSIRAWRINNDADAAGSVININGGSLNVDSFTPNAGNRTTLNITDGGSLTARTTFSIGASQSYTLNIVNGTFHSYSGDFSNNVSQNQIHLGSGGNLILENPTDEISGNFTDRIAQIRSLTNRGSWDGGTFTTNTRTITGSYTGRFLGGAADASNPWSSNPNNRLALSSYDTAQTFTLLGGTATANQGILAYRIYSPTSNDQIILDGGALSLGENVQIELSGHQLTGNVGDYIGATFQLFDSNSDTYGTLQASVPGSITLNINGVDHVFDVENNIASIGAITIIPEPSTYALGFGIFGLAIVFLRRRFQKR